MLTLNIFWNSSQTFVCQKFSNHSFNFSTCDCSVNFFCFFLHQSCTFERIFLFLLSCPFYLLHTVAYICYDPLFLQVSIVTSVSVLINLNPLPFFCDESGQRFIKFIFSKNQLSVSLIFFCCFVSISFISALIFTISFLPLILCFVCSFSVCFRCKIRLFIQGFSCFAINLPLRTTFSMSLGFGLLCFCFHLSLGIFFPPLISSVIYWLFSSILFSFQEFVLFVVFFFPYS